MASAFGGGSSQTAFGARAGATVLTKATSILGALFMIFAIALGITGNHIGGGSLMGGYKAPAPAPALPSTTPAAPAPTTPAPQQATPKQESRPRPRLRARRRRRRQRRSSHSPTPASPGAHLRESGGTGRRTSLRGWRSQERGGSNPPFRTIRLAFQLASGEPQGSLMASHCHGECPERTKLASGEPRGSLMASSCHGECPERAKRVEGPERPKFSPLSAETMASSSGVLGLHPSVRGRESVHRSDPAPSRTGLGAQPGSGRALHSPSASGEDRMRGGAPDGPCCAGSRAPAQRLEPSKEGGPYLRRFSGAKAAQSESQTSVVKRDSRSIA